MKAKKKKRLKNLHDASAVIAERTLFRCDTGANVVVKLFQPIPDPERTDIDDDTWACGYEITGLGDTIRDRVLGIDSMQALMLAWLR